MSLLQKVDLSIVTSDDCGKIHGHVIHPTNICAGVDGGFMGQCNDKLLPL